MDTLVKKDGLIFCVIPDKFNQSLNQTFNIDIVDGKDFVYYIDYLNDTFNLGIDIEDEDLVVSINGIIHKDFSCIKLNNGDLVSVGYSYKVAAIAAMLANLTGFAGPVLGEGLFSASVGWLISYGVAYIACSYLITTGLNMILKLVGLLPNQSESQNSSSPTYSWDGAQQTYVEGVPIPVVYGTHLVAGQIINQYTTLGNDGKEYYKAIICVNDGQVDDITDIKINDQDSSNYQGVTTYTRLGTLNQSVIPGFGEISNQRTPDIKLSYNVSNEYQTEGDAVEKIEIIITAPNGLSYANDDGGLDSRSVKIESKYRLVGSPFWISLSNTVLNGATTETVRKSIIIDNLTPGKYEVKLTRKTGNDSNFRENTDTYFSSFREVIKEEIAYNGLALVGVVALATDQLSGSTPTISCIVHRNTVSVYNPYTEIWESRNAQNLAWMCYGHAVNHHHFKTDRILYDEFYNWASYCDELVDGEPRFRASIVFDSPTNMLESLQRIAQLGRASIMKRGTKLGVFVDKPASTYEHIFSEANIIADSFSLYYMPYKDRANAVEVTYADPDRGYSRQIAPVYSQSYLTDATVEKKTSIQIDAAIRRTQAFREAAYALNSNEYLRKLVSFKAYTDSFTARVGGVVLFQHSIPDGDAKFSTRVVWVDDKIVKLNDKFSFKAGINYVILFRFSDDTFVQKSIVSFDELTLTDEIELLSAFTTEPELDDLCVIREAAVQDNWYRIITISKSNEDQIRTLTLIEYNENVFYGENYTIVEDEYTPPVVQEAVNVKARERLVYGGADYQSVIDLSWSPNLNDYGSSWTIFIQAIQYDYTYFDSDLAFDSEDVPFDSLSLLLDDPVDTTLKKVADTNYTSYTIPTQFLSFGMVYKIYVCPFNKGNADTGYNTTEITIIGKLNPPSDIENFKATYNHSIRGIDFSWSKIQDLDYAGINIRRGESWETGEFIFNSTAESFDTYLLPAGTVANVKYWAKAYDTSKIESENAVSYEISINTNYSSVEVPDDLQLSTSCSINNDGTSISTISAIWGINSSYSSLFKDYTVRIEEISSGNVEEVIVTENQYTFKVKGNIQYGVSVRANDLNNGSSNFCIAETIISATDSTAPGIPTWPTQHIVPGFKVIGLRWINPTDDDFAGIDAQRSEDNFVSNITNLGTKSGSFTTDTDLDVSTQYYYRIRSFDTSGNYSDWSSIVSTTTLQVGTSDIAYNSITADLIYVETLSALTEDVGLITAGIIQSDDWGTTHGVQIDLDDGTIKFGGSSSPKFEWNGTEIYIRNVDGSNEVEIDGSQVTIGNTINGDYCVLNSGDIDFYRYINGSHYLAKSLKRVEYGTATSGVTCQIPGYWKYPPKIITSPLGCQFFDPAYVLQGQFLNCVALNIEEVTVGSGQYKFLPRILLQLEDGFVNYSPPSGLGKSNSTSGTTANSSVFTTPPNTTGIGAFANWVIALSSGGDYYAHLSFNAYLVIDDTIEVLIYSISTSSLAPTSHYVDEMNDITTDYYNYNGTVNISQDNLTSAAHNLKVRIYYSLAGSYGISGTVSATITSLDCVLSSAVVISEGTMNYLATGE